MMARVFTGVKIVALLAISFCFVEAGLLFRATSKTLIPTLSQSKTFMASLQSDADGLGKTLAAVNDQRPGRGTLNILNMDLVRTKDLLNEVSATAKVVKDTTTNQAKLTGQWNQQLTDTLTGINKTTATLNTSIATVSDAATSTLQQVPATLNNADVALAAITNQVNNPAIPKILTNISSMTDSGSHILKDGADETHKLVHPDKVKLGFWGTINGGTLWIHRHIIPPLF